MTEKKATRSVSQIKAVLGEQEAFLKTLVQMVVQEVLERRWRTQWGGEGRAQEARGA